MKLTAELDRTFDLYSAGAVSKEGFSARYAPIEERRNRIRDEIPRLQGELDYLKISLASSDQFVRDAHDLYSRWTDLEFDEKCRVIEQVLDKVTVGPKEVELTLSFQPPTTVAQWPCTSHPTPPLCKVLLRAQKPPHRLFPREIRTFGDHLRARRMELGLSQPECARRLGVGLSSISNWERDTCPPDPKRLPLLHDFLGYCLVGDARPLRDRLREWRLRHGLTQRQVARRLGVTTKTVRRLEVTITRPTASVRRAVEELLTGAST